MQAACNRNDGQTGHRYQLRYAAGLYWLLDMEQSGAPYISPVPLNEGGAKIWSLIESGTSKAEICEQLSGMYEIPLDQAQKDVHDFIEQLRSKHIDFGGFE